MIFLIHTSILLRLSRVVYGNASKYETIHSGSIPFSTWTDTIVAAATFARAQL